MITQDISNPLHCFSFGGSALAINPESLFLYEALPFSLDEQTRLKYQQITDRKPCLRNIEQERKIINNSRKQLQDYLYLNVSHACNMGCPYCFAKGGTYGGKNQLMEPDIACAAIDWFLRFGTGDRLTLHFFGGEPLMNVQTVRATLNHARIQTALYGKPFRALITTNGTQDICELGDVLFSVSQWITISIDGPASIHDLSRPLRNGSSSYNLIAANVKRYIQLAGNSHLSAKATWRRGCSDLILIAESLIDLGFSCINIGRETSVESSNIQPENRSTHRDFDEIFSAYEKLACWYTDQLNEGHRIVVQPLHSIMYAVLHAQVMRKMCPAGISTWCVVPNGDIYPCHRFVENISFRAGHVFGDNPNLDILEGLPPYGFLPNECDGCWARYWCFSNSCIFLTSINKEFHLLNGFCQHMRQFLEMICYYVTKLSIEGRKTLQSTKITSVF